MARATWNGALLAESDRTTVVERNHYFPANSLQREHFVDSRTTSICPWKGTASYYTLEVDGQTNVDAAWYYPDPKKLAEGIKDSVAFWKGVEITD